MDYEQALKEAIEKLIEEHRVEDAKPEDLMSEVLKEKPVDSKDAKRMKEIVGQLEEIYFLAVETERDSDFNKPSVMNVVLTRLFPQWKMRWSNEQSKAKNKGKKLNKFEDLLRFLSVQKDAAVAFERMDSTSAEKPDDKTVEKKQMTKEVPKEKPDDEGFIKVERKKPATAGASTPGSAAPRAPTASGASTPRVAPIPPAHDCNMCRGKHWLERCPDFKKKSIGERWEFCERRRLCKRCLRWSHPTAACRFEGKCIVCDEVHHTMLHGAKEETESKEPVDLVDLSAEPSVKTD